jgi:capsular polysaccharide transport system permease protein
MPAEVRNGDKDGPDRREISAVAVTFVLMVIVPTLAAIIYYGYIASDIYVAEAHYAIRTSTENPAPGLANSLLGSASTGTSAGEDGMIVRDYTLSRDMLEELDSLLDLRRHYGSDRIDFLARLREDVSLEAFVEYYQEMVEIEIDPESQISMLRVRAFDAETAQQLAESIVKFSEALVNRMSERIVDDTLKFARSEVAKAEASVRRASDALTGFRSVSRSIDPAQETSAVLSIVTQLESTLAIARSELIQAESFMNPDSVQVKNLRARANALDQQVRSERQRLSADGQNTKDYTRLIGGYEPLLLEKVLAEQLWSSALISLETARAEAQRKQRYLITFVSPKLPDEAVEPNRLMATTTVFAGALLLYVISGLLWAAIKDHMRM